MVAEVCAPANGAIHLTKQPIIPTAVYDRDEAVAVTGFSQSTLIRAEERGVLNGRYQGRRRFYLGCDLLAWLGAQAEEGAPA